MGRVEPAVTIGAPSRAGTIRRRRRLASLALVAPEFLAEAKQRGLEVNPVSGAAIDRLLGELYETPPDVFAEVRAVISEGAR